MAEFHRKVDELVYHEIGTDEITQVTDVIDVVIVKNYDETIRDNRRNKADEKFSECFCEPLGI